MYGRDSHWCIIIIANVCVVRRGRLWGGIKGVSDWERGGEGGRWSVYVCVGTGNLDLTDWIMIDCTMSLEVQEARAVQCGVKGKWNGEAKVQRLRPTPLQSRIPIWNQSRVRLLGRVRSGEEARWASCTPVSGHVPTELEEQWEVPEARLQCHLLTGKNEWWSTGGAAKRFDWNRPRGRGRCV